MACIISTLEEDIRRFLAINSGSGSGDGSGDGSGSGSGYGSGSGDGSGSGYGSGSGFGSGSGNWKAINGQRIYYIDSLPTVITQVRHNVAKGFFVGKDLAFRPCYIARYDNFFAHGDTIRAAISEATEKWLEQRPVEERLADFVKEHPDLDTPYGDLFKWHHILTGSCTAGREQWCREHGYKPTDSITVRAFIDQTRFDYGHEVIAQLEKLYKS